jgi:hypothetical protein
MKLPKWLQAIKDVWMKMSHAIGMVMSRILLTVLWVVIFGLYGIVIKIVALFTRIPKKESYWIDVPEEFEGSMKHQF